MLIYIFIVADILVKIDTQPVNINRPVNIYIDTQPVNIYIYIYGQHETFKCSNCYLNALRLLLTIIVIGAVPLLILSESGFLFIRG